MHVSSNLQIVNYLYSASHLNEKSDKNDSERPNDLMTYIFSMVVNICRLLGMIHWANIRYYKDKSYTKGIVRTLARTNQVIKLQTIARRYIILLPYNSIHN